MTWIMHTELPPHTYGNRCCVCFSNRTGDRWYDGGIEVAGEGRYVICGLCANGLGRCMGWIPRDEAKVELRRVPVDPEVYLASVGELRDIANSIGDMVNGAELL
ncbi:MAG: hypothetical protein ACRD6B_03935 [Bryobacteraceae bacterium]